MRRPTLESILVWQTLSISIVNGVDSFVIGGRRTELEAACQEAGAWCEKLPCRGTRLS